MNKITVEDALKTIRQLMNESSEGWDIAIGDSFEDSRDEAEEANSQCIANYISAISLLASGDQMGRNIARDLLLDAKKLEDEWLNSSYAQMAIEAVDSISDVGERLSEEEFIERAVELCRELVSNIDSLNDDEDYIQ